MCLPGCCDQRLSKRGTASGDPELSAEVSVHSSAPAPSQGAQTHRHKLQSANPVCYCISHVSSTADPALLKTAPKIIWHRLLHLSVIGSPLSGTFLAHARLRRLSWELIHSRVRRVWRDGIILEGTTGLSTS